MSKRRAKGEGAITYSKSKGKFQGSYQTSDGRRRYVYADTQRECSRRLAELRRKADSGLDVVNARAPLSAFVDHWLEENRQHWRDSTYTHNESIARLYVVAHLGDTPLDKVDVPTVQKWLRKLRAQADSTDQPRRALRILREILAAAVRWRILDYNAATLVKPPKHTPRRGVALTEEQTDALLAAVQGHRLEALYHVAIELGLRRGELLGLKWEDVDLNEGTLTVQSGKTEAARRTLPLNGKLVAQLRQHWLRQSAEWDSLGDKWKENGLVFPSQVGTPLPDVSLYRHFKRTLNQAGLPDELYFHDLRHTCLTRLAAQGKPPAIWQYIAGHTNPALALQVYTHVSLADVRAALAIVW